MKLHLPCRLYRAVQACLVIGTVSVTSFSYATVSLEDELQMPYVDVDKYPRGNTSYTSRQTSSLTLSQYVSITFQDIAYSQRSYTSDNAYAYGGAVYLSGSTQLFSLSNNGIVSFSGNSASSTATAYNANAYAGGGAIWNNGSFSLSNNQYVFFSNNTTSSSSNTSSTASPEGGAIYNKGTFKLNGNGGIAFCGNFAAYGGAICNEGSFTLSDNGTLSFSDNSAVCGVVFNAYYASFTLSNNRAVAFSGNSSKQGSAIYNNGTFTLSNNGDVIFNSNKGTSNAYGGAIYNNKKSTFNLNGNECVSFRLNTADAFGGAIRNEGIIKLLDNAEILFIDNKVSSTTADGGAIYNNGSFTVNGNGELSFSGNSATYGGVIYNCGGSSFTLNGNGDVTIRENLASSGGAIYNCEKSTFTLSNNGDIIFSGNKGASFSNKGASSSGGAICNSGTFALNGNGKICFRGNNVSTSTSAYGSAIFNSGVFTLSNNGELTFSDNTASSSAFVYGSAIYNTGTFSLSSNGDVYFSGNTASSSSSSTSIGYGAICNEGDFKLLDNGDVLFNGNTTLFAYGGAISNKGSFSLSSNGNISFCNNSTSFSSHANGGAIYNDRAFSMLDNGCVTFLDNSATSSGGAIYNSGTFDLRRNVAVTFNGNSTSSTYTYGGAIANFSNTFTLTDNGVVTFSGNSAFSSSSDPSSSSSAKGGAIHNSGGNTLFSLEGNAAVTFIGNTASSASSAAYGGAIFNNSSSVFTLSGNGAVSFCNNNASSYYRSSSRYAEGGAIFNDGAFTISGNGDVTFSGNSVSTGSSSYAMGGAIYNSGDDFHDATFSLSGNGNVLFEKNVEKTATSCHLRSIYSNGILNLAASEGKSITFRDTIYAEGEVNMNQDYTDSEGVTHQSTGSIIFTGATTEADLREMKGGVDGTSMEIQNSRFSEIKGTLTLNSGTLIVQDQAQLQTDSLVIKSGASVMLKNGSIITTADSSCILMDCSLKISSGAALTLCGNLFLNGVVDMEISGFDNGTYILLSASSITGSDNLAINIVSGDSGMYKVAWNEKGNELMLTVAGVTPPAPPLYERDTPISHIWTAPSGVLSFGSVIEHDAFMDGDSLEIQGKASIKVSSMVQPAEILVNSASNVTFTSDKKVYGSGISGEGSVTKSGAGMLTMNAGNTYSGGTVLNAGTLKATAVDSFGRGAITVNGGTLDLGSKAVANDIVLSGTATLKGDAKYTGSVTVAGDAALSAKTSYKGLTTIGSGSSLTLAEKATMAGSIAVDGGRFIITAPKGMTLAKGATMTLDNGGAVRGLLTVGAGSTLVWADGSFETAAPVLKGGTLDFGAENSLTLTGSKAQVAFGDKRVELPGKGVVYTDETLTVNSGTVTLNAVNGYESGIEVAGGTLKLATGKVATDNEITVSGNAAVVNGKMHFGNITVNGTLAKGTNITIADGKTVQLNGAGVMLGTIAGAGTVDVNASIDATAAKITAAHINLNNGTFTNTKGIKLAKGQTLTLAGAALNLGPKGALATAAGSTLVVSSATSLTGNLTLGGGELVFAGGSLDVDGMLTLSKAMTVKGSGSITYTTLKPFKGDISVLFGGAEVVQEGNTLTITGEEAVGYRLAPAPLDTTPALPPAPVTNPVADAMVQADWGILDAERAFMGAVNSRHQHAALLDKGRGAAWGSAFGSSVRHGNKGAHHGSDGNIEGAAFGLEHAVSESGSIGLAVGRSKNRLSATGVTHLRQETAHVALYGQKQLAHGFTADAAAAYGDTETKLGAASWQQKSAALTARLTHAQQLTDATAFRTFGGLAYEATDAGSLGATHTGSVQNLRAELGAGITHTAGKAHFYAEAALTGDMVRHNPIADLDGTRTHGANPGRIGLRATVGGLYEFTDTWSGTASYGIETESRSTSHTLNIGVSKSF